VKILKGEPYFSSYFQGIVGEPEGTYFIARISSASQFFLQLFLEKYGSPWFPG
jgi:hypothetical protein